MMPLALWAGMAPPECECADGQHRFYCPGALNVVTKVSPDSKHACCLPKRCCQAAADKTVAKSCCRADQASGGNTPGSRASGLPCGHCKSIPSSALALNKAVSLPELDRAAFFVAAIFTAVSIDTVSPTWSANLEPIETGPPLDRVIVFRCLLI